jgi:chromosome partitioning protein
MKRVVFNLKGGVGKSSITCNLAAVSAAEGYRTLVVDLDSQANATQYLTGQVDELPCGIADFFRQTLHPGAAKKARVNVHETRFERLHLLAASPELAELQGKLESRFKVNKLARLLDRLAADYDRIYLDTPPGLNFYSLSALIAADRCLIPFDCDSFSLQALQRVVAEIDDIQEEHNPRLRLEGIVVNQYQPRASLPQRLIAELAEQGLPVLPVYLSSSVRMRESHHAATPLIHFDPAHKLTRQYVELLDALERHT